MFNLLAHIDDEINEGVADHMTNSGHWMGDGGFAVFWMIVFGLAMTIFIILVVKYFSGTKTSENTSDNDSLAVAKNRYAKGEIDKKEFNQIKKDLQ